ncbi:MAG: inositol monophosphatase [Candidatus Eisenbacteria sp.]|nr:inositol monophosphatase [Candidatus Eisenbacteria bacterium]
MLPRLVLDGAVLAENGKLFLREPLFAECATGARPEPSFNRGCNVHLASSVDQGAFQRGGQVLEFAKAIARQAGERLMKVYGSPEGSQVDFKGRRDMVTEADRAAEMFLAGEISERFPTDAILAEESIRKDGSSGRVWILDPLDGTTNFVHGHPMFCVSVALAEGYAGLPRANTETLDDGASGFFRSGNEPRLLVGVVCAPVFGELYWAERGGGAWLNGRKLRVSSEQELDRCLVATGFAYRRNELSNNNLGNFNRLVLQAQGVRRGGAAALDLCFVAAGRFDAFWELYLKPWDVAAGMLLVSEAQGRVTGLAEESRALEGVEIVASNGAVHEQIRCLLEGPDPAWAESERARVLP